MLNPVFRREMRTALRTWKTYCAIAIYSLAMTGVAALMVYSLYNSAYYGGLNPGDTSSLYILLTAFQLGLVLLITPALTAGAISGERERQTLDLMVITKMSAFTIVVGKLVSSLMVVLLMIVASMPVFAIIFYYGGVSLLNLIGITLFTMVTAAMVGSVALFFSSLLKKTIGSTVLTYIVIIALSIGTLIAVFMVSILLTSNRYYYSGATPIPTFKFMGRTVSASLLVNAFLLSFNPMVAFVSVIDGQFGTYYSWELAYDMARLYGYNNGDMPPLWIFYCIFCILIIALLLFLTARVLNPVKASRKYK